MTMNVVLFDDPAIRVDLLPFTFTRPVSGIRVGVLTIAGKWGRYLDTECSWLTEAYLQPKFPLQVAADNFFINGALCPDPEIAEVIRGLEKNQSLTAKGLLLAGRTGTGSLDALVKGNAREYTRPFVIIDKSWKIFRENGGQIKADFAILTAGRSSHSIIDPHTRVYNAQNIFVESGVSIRASVLNAENGPIYLGKDSVIQEGCLIKGPFALCSSSFLNMGCKMRGDTTVGPNSKVGGEVSNSVFFGRTSKLHDGFMGNSVIGEWCNFGADTNTSNMKNNYDQVRVWSYASAGFEDTGLQFCGLLMGDHSKCGINTMFNTGTVVGVSANIFGSGYPRQFIPSFSWGGAHGFSTFQLGKALETAERAMSRRNTELGETDRNIISAVFEQTRHFRKREK
jgi:UDP-N-acetylglucosamine diphosphorylase/glucosamine-1-phosphate N-acetyltransferase